MQKILPAKIRNLPLILSHAHELFSMWANKSGPTQAAAKLRHHYFRQRRYLGSADRSLIEFLFYDIIRHLRLYEWQIHRNSARLPRNILPAYLIAHSFMKHFPGSLSSLQFRSSDPLAQIFETYTLNNTLPEEPQIRYSIPELLWREIHWHYPSADLEACLAAMLDVFSVHIRVNPLLGTVEEISAALQDLEPEKGRLSPLALRTTLHRRLEQHPLYRKGYFEFQDESSQLLAYACAPAKNDRIYDVCAGAGGKSLHLAALQKDSGNIIASDIDFSRLRELERRTRRAAIRSVRITPADSSELHQAGSADILLIDAPCSGSGVYGRHPDRKWALSRRKLDHYIRTQKEILDRYADQVRRGGILVYATCSLIPAENHHQIENFLQRHPDYCPDSLSEAFGQYNIELNIPESAHMLQILPHEYGSDGFFISRLKRV
jgi:16S rRNA (cytosine967-C5)-methyltransferase